MDRGLCVGAVETVGVSWGRSRYGHMRAWQVMSILLFRQKERIKEKFGLIVHHPTYLHIFSLNNLKPLLVKKQTKPFHFAELLHVWPFSVPFWDLIYYKCSPVVQTSPTIMKVTPRSLDHRPTITATKWANDVPLTLLFYRSQLDPANDSREVFVHVPLWTSATWRETLT